MNWTEFYENHYKALMALSLLILVVSAGFLAWQKQSTGEYFKKSVDLRGGTQLTVDVAGDVDVQALQTAVASEHGSTNVRELGGVGDRSLLISVGEVEPDAVIATLEANGVTVNGFSSQQIGPSLGASFFEQSQKAFLFAFGFMALVVFIAFRNFVPSIAVIQAALTDVVAVLAVMQVINIELSLASFAGIMLIIGYSVDTDIMLTTRMLKRTGDATENMVEAMKTGLTMTASAIVVLLALFFTATTSVISDIAAVLLIALIVDIPITYLTNAGMLRWWLESKGRL